MCNSAAVLLISPPVHILVSQVAAEAIKQAEREGRHVVLVDTAGRMQVRLASTYSL